MSPVHQLPTQTKIVSLVCFALLVVMMLFRPEGLIPSARRKAEFEEGGEEAVLYGARGE